MDESDVQVLVAVDAVHLLPHTQNLHKLVHRHTFRLAASAQVQHHCASGIALGILLVGGPAPVVLIPHLQGAALRAARAVRFRVDHSEAKARHLLHDVLPCRHKGNFGGSGGAQSVAVLNLVLLDEWIARVHPHRDILKGFQLNVSVEAVLLQISEGRQAREAVVEQRPLVRRGPHVPRLQGALQGHVAQGSEEHFQGLVSGIPLLQLSQGVTDNFEMPQSCLPSCRDKVARIGVQKFLRLLQDLLAIWDQKALLGCPRNFRP
mmetsp:Transcript_66835/g.159488  ORF Transcript_66835/g.159488 Transcript_66835/m.159488 type:complete len:263 (+) Transcript_66835:1517-2305(+)